MDGAITAIYRYPVKGLSAEALDRVALSVGSCLPQDRRFAIALGPTEFDPSHPAWLSKSHFIMLMRDEALAQLHTSFAPDSGVLSIERDGHMLIEASLSEPAGARQIARFFDDFLASSPGGGAVTGPLRVVEAEGHAFADARRKPNATADQYVSLINRNSVRALEDKLGAPVAPLRFRANVYFDGPPAWRELDWLGREIAVGGARLKGVSAITRCAATQVNPATAERDLDIVSGLMRHFDHNLMGIYAEVLGAGDIAIGDRIVAGG